LRFQKGLDSLVVAGTDLPCLCGESFFVCHRVAQRVASPAGNGKRSAAVDGPVHALVRRPLPQHTLERPVIFNLRWRLVLDRHGILERQALLRVQENWVRVASKSRYCPLRWVGQ